MAASRKMNGMDDFSGSFRSREIRRAADSFCIPAPCGGWNARRWTPPAPVRPPVSERSAVEYRCKVTVIGKKLFPELQAQCCAVLDSGK